MSHKLSRNPSRNLSPADWLATAAVAVAASLLAWAALWPIGPGNDQALFLYYARAMREGATLYIDLWDNKPPGIFAFYVGAAALFGEGWGAVRLAFALWLGVGAGAMAALCRIVAPGRIAWMIAPALTVGLALLRLDAERPSASRRSDAPVRPGCTSARPSWRRSACGSAKGAAITVWP